MASGSALVRRYRRRLLVVIGLVALMSAVGVGFGMQIAGAAAKRSLQQSAQEVLLVQEQVLNGLMEKFRLLPNLVRRNAKILGVFVDPSEKNIAAAQLAIRHDSAMTGALDIVLLELDGSLLVSGTGVVTGSFEPTSRLLGAVRQGRLGRKAIQIPPDERAYAFASGLRDEGGNLVGVIAVLVDLANLEQIWSLSTLPVLVADRDGTVLASNRAEWRMMPLNEIRSQERGVIEYVLDGQFQPYVEMRRAVPVLEWELYVLAGAAPIVRARIAAAASVVLAGLTLAIFLAYMMRRRLELVQKNRTDKANSLRLERVVRDRTRALTLTNQALAEEVEHHKKTGISLRKTQDELIQTGKLAALGQMSTSLSHEFNQPLAATKSYADNALILLERNRQAEAEENIRLISKMADRMAVISRHLRNFGRKPRTRLSSILVEAVINDAIEVLSVRLREQGADIIVEHETPEAQAIAGHVRLQQVVVNLISNALDATISGSTKPVQVFTSSTDKKVLIRVRDFGPGIAPGHLAHIFDPFFTTKEPGRGLGLGLSISYNIVKDFGGRLTGENHPEGGALFTIELERA